MADLWKISKSIQASVSTTDNNLKSVINNLNKLESSFNNFKTLVHNLNTELSQLKEEKAAMVIDIKALNDKISILENKPNFRQETDFELLREI